MDIWMVSIFVTIEKGMALNVHGQVLMRRYVLIYNLEWHCDIKHASSKTGIQLYFKENARLYLMGLCTRLSTTEPGLHQVHAGHDAVRHVILSPPPTCYLFKTPGLLSFHF